MRRILLTGAVLLAALAGCSSTCRDIKGGIGGDRKACKMECLRKAKEERKRCECSTLCSCWREH